METDISDVTFKVIYGLAEWPPEPPLRCINCGHVFDSENFSGYTCCNKPTIQIGS